MNQATTVVGEESVVRFLLIEDDDDHARIVIRSLRVGPLVTQITHLKDGIEALAFLRHEHQYARETLPDVVLLDLKLPKLDGHEVLAAIKADEKLRNLPVVILTTSDAQSDMANAYRLFANSYLVKPIDGPSFQKMIQSLREYWGVWNRSPVRTLEPVGPL